MISFSECEMYPVITETDRQFGTLNFVFSLTLNLQCYLGQNIYSSGPACRFLHLLPRSQEAQQALVLIGYQGLHGPGPGPCVQSQELRTRLWRGDRCDVMTFAGLFKLCSTADAARRMKSDAFHGMEFTMGRSKTWARGVSVEL